jgi:hypothetical protein
MSAYQEEFVVARPALPFSHYFRPCFKGSLYRPNRFAAKLDTLHWENVQLNYKNFGNYILESSRSFAQEKQTHDSPSG